MLLKSPKSGVNYWSRSSSTLYPLTTSDKLQIDGAVIFSSTLGVSGFLTASSSLTVGSTCNISSGVYLGDQLDVVGNITGTSGLNITGATILSSTLGVTGKGTFSSAVDITGLATMSSNADILGNLDISSSLTVASTSNISSSQYIGGSLTVNSSGQFTTSVGISNTLDVTGLITASTGIKINTDSAGLQLGASQDALIQFNGTDLKITESVTAGAELDVDVTGGVYNFGLNEATDSAIRVWDSDKTRYAQFSHNSSVLAITASAGDIAINPSGSSIISFGESHAVDTKIRVFDSDKTDYIEITHNSTNAQVGSNAGGILLNPTNGVVGIYKSAVDCVLQIYDSDVTDILSLTHNSTNAVITTNAGELILTAPTTITLGTGAAGVDYILKFDGETSDGTITFMEDEARFDFSQPIKIANIKSGATQVAAGAAAGEVFKTSGHATLPDNVLLIGV